MVEFDPTEIWEIDGKLGFRQEKKWFYQESMHFINKEMQPPNMFDTVVYQLMRYFWFWLVTAQDIDVSSWLIVICCVVGKGETWDTSKN